MSFRRLLERSVTLVPRIVVGEDARGNEVIGDGTPIAGVPAGRDFVTSDEDLEARDQVETRWLYFLPARLGDGTELAPQPYDRIQDGDQLLEFRGRVDAVHRRRTGRLHHYEAVAYLIEG